MRPILSSSSKSAERSKSKVIFGVSKELSKWVFSSKELFEDVFSSREAEARFEASEVISTTSADAFLSVGVVVLSLAFV